MNTASRFAVSALNAAMLISLSIPVNVSAESQSHTVQVSATILPRLELTITSDTGSSIAFGALMQPDEGIATKAVGVNLSVFSNLDRPYHVTQSVRHPLSSESGSDIPDKQFMVSARGASRGSVFNDNPTPIVPGESATLYTSDAHGKSDAFTADYHLAVTPTTPAGNYSTEIVYTVTSL